VVWICSSLDTGFFHTGLFPYHWIVLSGNPNTPHQALGGLTRLQTLVAHSWHLHILKNPPCLAYPSGWAPDPLLHQAHGCPTDAFLLGGAKPFSEPDLRPWPGATWGWGTAMVIPAGLLPKQTPV